MTQTPDPQGAPERPAAPPRRRGPGAAFWLVIGFGLACIAGGFVLATFGPRLLPPRPAAAIPVTTPTLPTETSADTPTEAHALLTPPQTPRADIGAFDDRLARLEEGQARATSAAALALAAAALEQAAQTSRPFAGELTAFEQISPAAPQIAALRPLALTGAPSRATLAADLEDAATRAARVARSPDADDSLVARARHALASVITVRRVVDRGGDGPDSLLARAQRQADDGDLEAAVRTLERLPPAVQEAMAPWRVRAARRIEIDRTVAALREQALRELVRSTPRGQERAA